MRWRKLGRIFDPAGHALPLGCRDYAQSPQVLDLGDAVRVFFSTRAPDPAAGKVLSHVAYVDMDRSLGRVLGVSGHEVIPLGGLGCFDEHGIFPMNVLRHGGLVYGFTCGWSRRVSVPVETAIGLALSRDGGRTFRRSGEGPVLSASLHEPCLVGDGFVLHRDGLFHMWYIFGTGWQRGEEGPAPERTYKIGHAVSRDAVRWEREEGRRIIPDRLEDECQALPTVVEVAGRHHMFFCYRRTFDFRRNPDHAYRIGHAWSDDLSTWTRDDDDPSLAGTPGDWDGEMQCYPHAFVLDGRVLLLYNGNEFGRHGFGLAELEDLDLAFAADRADAAQIAAHLAACDADFVPPLSRRVDIAAYADKLVGHAVRFEAWEGGRLVGLVAAYCNDPDGCRAFVTSVSVLRGWAGRGIAVALMERCLSHARRLGFRRVALEVDAANGPARRLYEKLGFTVAQGGPPALLFVRDLQAEGTDG